MRGELVVESGHYINVTDIAFAPGGRLLATASADETLRLWDLRMGCEAGILRGHSGPVYHALFDGTGDLLASGGWDHDVRIWDVAARQTRRVLRGITRHPVDALALAGDGSLAAATGLGVQNAPRQLIVWQVESGAVVRSLDVPGHVSGNARTLAFTPDATALLYADSDDRLHRLDLEGGSDDVLFVFDGPPPELVTSDQHGIVPVPPPGIGHVLMLDDERALLICRDGLRLLELATGTVQVIPGVGNRPWRGARLEDGTVALFGEGVELWNVQPSGSERLGTVNVPAEAISGDGALLAGADGRHVQLFDRVSGCAVRRLGSRLSVPRQPGNQHRQFVLATSPLAPVLVHGGPDGFVRIWDLAHAVAPRAFHAHAGAVDAVAVSPDGRLVATGEQDAALWRIADGTPVWRKPIKGGVKRLAFSADGSALLVGQWRGGLRCLESATGRSAKAIPLQGPVDALTVSPWNDVLAVHFRSLRAWQPFLQGKPSPQELPAAAHDLAISPAGLLAIGVGYSKWMSYANRQGEGIVLVMDVRGEPSALRGHEANVRSVAFSHDGSRLASGSEDGQLILWDVARRRATWRVNAHAGDVTGLGFTAGDRFLASIGLDGVIRLWDEHGGLTASLISLDDDDFVVVTDENYYSATREGLRAVKLRLDDRLLAFEQFDLESNRPDLVLQRLGYADANLVASYADMHDRRLERLGRVAAPLPGRPPVVRVPDPPGAVAHQASLRLRVVLEPGDQPLDRLVVSINDVPVHGREGLPVGDRTTMDVDVQLAVGDNDLELWATDAAGVQSLRFGQRVFLPDPGVERTLYVLTVGVSAYRDPRRRLDFAAKDARDLAAALRALQQGFAHVETRVLEDATLREILAAGEFLRRGRVDDQAIVLFAGHGTLQGGRFYFLPADYDPADLARSAVSYEQLELLFDGIPPRRRLLLIDACHSGEPDGGEAPAAVPVAGVRTVRSFRDLPAAEAPLPRRERPRALVPALQEIFADLRQESGTYVLAAAGAAEYAFEEGELQNGVFTACIIRALRAAVPNGIRVSALARAVAEQVAALTGGGQRPVSRRENLADDFVVA